MNKNIQNINRIIAQINATHNLLDFDNIELPFELLKAVIAFLDETFTDDTLDNLAKNDSDTLDAWAIALNQSLPNQLTLFSRWQNYLNNSPIPPKLQEKITTKITEIKEIDDQKSELSKQYEQLFKQEQTLQESKQKLLHP